MKLTRREGCSRASREVARSRRLEVAARSLFGCSADASTRDKNRVTMQLVSAILGAAVGAGVGLALQRLLGRPLAQSVLALLLGWILGSLIAAALWLALPPSGLDVLAVSMGLAESGLGVLLVVGIAAGSHALMGSLAHLIPGLALNRALVLGTVGGLWGAVTFGSAWGLTRPVG
jgi:hypothetical protein